MTPVGARAAPGVPPDMLIDPDHPDAVEPVGVLDQDPRALGQDRVVGGVPRDSEVASSAHRRPRRDSFARGSAALLVS